MTNIQSRFCSDRVCARLKVSENVVLPGWVRAFQTARVATLFVTRFFLIGFSSLLATSGKRGGFDDGA